MVVSAWNRGEATEKFRHWGSCLVGGVCRNPAGRGFSFYSEGLPISSLFPVRGNFHSEDEKQWQDCVAEPDLRWNPAFPGADGMAKLISESDSVLISWRICTAGASAVRATVTLGGCYTRGPAGSPDFPKSHTVLEYHRRDWIRPSLAAEVSEQLLTIGSKTKWFSSLGRETPVCLGCVFPKMVSMEQPLWGRPQGAPNGSAESEYAVRVCYLLVRSMAVCSLVMDLKHCCRIASLLVPHLTTHPIFKMEDPQAHPPAASSVFSLFPSYYSLSCNTKAVWKSFSTDAMLDHKTQPSGLSCPAQSFWGTGNHADAEQGALEGAPDVGLPMQLLGWAFRLACTLFWCQEALLWRAGGSAHAFPGT